MILQLKLKFEQQFYLYLLLLFISQISVAYNCNFTNLILFSFLIFHLFLKFNFACKFWIFFIVNLTYAQYCLPSLKQAKIVNETIIENGTSIYLLNAQIIQAPKRPYYGLAKIACQTSFLGLKNIKVILEYPDVPWEILFDAQAGDNIQIAASIEGLVNTDQYPEPFSYSAYLLRRGFLAKGKILEILRVNKKKRTVNEKENFIKKLIKEYSSTPELSLMVAATLGYNYLLDDYTKNIFKISGMTHLIVVSGYHVAVIFSVLFYFFKKTLLQSSTLISVLPLHRVAAIFSLIFVYFYTIIVGEDLTTVRALIALLILSLGKIFLRRQDSLKAYFFVMFIILFLWPASFFEAGFELTFMALLGLIIAANLSKKYFQNKNVVFKFCFKHLCFSFFPALFTTPVILFWFNFFSPLSVFYNLLFSQAFCLIFILIPAACFLMMYAGIKVIKPIFLLNLFCGKKIIDFLDYLTAFVQ